jgi:hypothetical protein
MASERYREQFIALFVMGLLVLSYPLLSLFDSPMLVLGVPLLYFYVFLAWIAIIVLAAVVVEIAGGRGGRVGGGEERG